MSEIETGGGAHIGRDVNPGNDYVGRDKTNVGDGSSMSRVDVNIPIPRRYADDPSDADILRGMQTAFADIKELKTALLGNPSNPRYQPGLVRTVEGLIDSVAGIVAEQRRAESDRADIRQSLSAQREDILAAQREALERQMDGTNTKLEFLMSRTTIISIALIVIAVLLVGGAVFVWTTREFSEVPAAGVQSPHRTAEETKSAEGEKADLPVAGDAYADTNDGDTVGGEAGAVGVAGFAWVFPEPFPIFGPDVPVENPAGE